MASHSDRLGAGGLYPAASFRGLAILVFAALVLRTTAAEARTRRPLFEPTDLEMEDTGIAELDLQMGGIRSQAGPWRLVLPDFELDVGVLPNLEFDIDGAYAIEGPANGPFSLDHAAPDSLWPSVKVGIYDHPASAGASVAFAVGGQAGPKLPVAHASHGVGAEALLLIGLTVHRLHSALNVGLFADCAPDGSSPRPKGLESGLDLSLDLDANGRFSATGEVSAVRFATADPTQLLATAGLTWSAMASLDLSVVGLVGVLNGSDRYGALLGVSPKMRLFGAAAGKR